MFVPNKFVTTPWRLELGDLVVFEGQHAQRHEGQPADLSLDLLQAGPFEDPDHARAAGSPERLPDDAFRSEFGQDAILILPVRRYLLGPRDGPGREEIDLGSPSWRW
jgi:hypothetical protein